MIRRLLAAAVAGWLLFGGGARAEGLLIIANPGVAVPVPVPPSEIAAIYLLRLTTWPDGSHIVPVNREATSTLRAKFTARVLQEDNADLATYWNEMHYMGKMPPVVQESRQAMIAFVRNVPGAIGYISGSRPPLDVKVLAYVP
jgi:ABC-type phosphate transport system substrate-binding protein